MKEKVEKKRIPAEKERVLNLIVERHKMCSPNSVGQVSELVLYKKLKFIKDWENFYFTSGRKRKKIIVQNSKKFGKSKLKKLISGLNKSFGRTEEELEEKGEELFKYIPEETKRLSQAIDVLKNITEKDCKDCIKQYVIDNTWVGIIKRENAVIKKLIKRGIKPENIKKTTGSIDTNLGVDREIFSDDMKKKIGLQIKPDNSRGGPLIDEHIKSAQAKYKGRVITIFSNTKGKIRDEDKIIKEIKNELGIKNQDS